jgi:hypothetical protein
VELGKLLAGLTEVITAVNSEMLAKASLAQNANT